MPEEEEGEDVDLVAMQDLVVVAREEFSLARDLP